MSHRNPSWRISARRTIEDKHTNDSQARRRDQVVKWNATDVKHVLDQARFPAGSDGQTVFRSKTNRLSDDLKDRNTALIVEPDQSTATEKRRYRVVQSRYRPLEDFFDAFHVVCRRWTNHVEVRSETIDPHRCFGVSFRGASQLG